MRPYQKRTVGGKHRVDIPKRMADRINRRAKKLGRPFNYTVIGLLETVLEWADDEGGTMKPKPQGGSGHESRN